MDAFVVRGLAGELGERLTGAKLRGAGQSSATSFWLRLYADQEHYLVIDISPGQPFILLQAEPPPSYGKRAVLIEYIDTRLRSSKISDISSIRMERILQIALDKLQLDGSKLRYRLHIEIMGRNSNAILESGGIIIDAFKRFSLAQGSSRLLLPKAPWQPPPLGQGIYLHQVNPKILARIMQEAPQDKPPWKALFENISGISPRMAKEAIQRADDAASNRAQPGWIQAMNNYLQQLAQVYQDKAFKPCIYQEGEKGESRFCLSLCHMLSLKPISEPSLFIQGMQELQRLSAQVRARKHLEARLNRTIQAAIKNTQKLINELEKEIARYENHQLYRKYGELLLINKSRLKEAKEIAVVEDIYQDNKTMEIPLEPNTSITGNANRYFNLSRKFARGLKIKKEQLTARQDELDFLSQVMEKLKKAYSTEQLQRIAQILSERGYTVHKGSKHASERGKRSALPFHRFISSESFEILVGKSARDNEELLSRYASVEDFWLHVKDAGGSFVIVRNPQRLADLPQNTKLEAAHLAVRYSSIHGKVSNAEVLCTKKKYLRKVKGTSGLVNYSNEQVISISLS